MTATFVHAVKFWSLKNLRADAKCEMNELAGKNETGVEIRENAKSLLEKMKENKYMLRFRAL